MLKLYQNVSVLSQKSKEIKFIQPLQQDSWKNPALWGDSCWWWDLSSWTQKQNAKGSSKRESRGSKMERTFWNGEIRGSYGSDFDDCRLLGCDAMQTSVSKEPAAFVCRVEEWRENKGSSILKIEAAGFFETLVTFYQTPWCHIKEDIDFQQGTGENSERMYKLRRWIFKDDRTL